MAGGGYAPGIGALFDGVAKADVIGVFQPVSNLPPLCGLACKHVGDVAHAYFCSSRGGVVEVGCGRAQITAQPAPTFN